MERRAIELPFQPLELERSKETAGEKTDVSLSIGECGRLDTISLLGTDIQIPRDVFDPIETKTEQGGTIKCIDFRSHPMNMNIRFGEMTDPTIADPGEDMILLSIQESDATGGLVIPRVLGDGSITAKAVFNGDMPSITLFRFVDGKFQEIEPGKPTSEHKILHGTQILGHVKDACDMQQFAHNAGSLEKWEFAFPPTTRRSVNQAAIASEGVPTDMVTNNWVYGPESEELPSDFTNPESIETILGFLAANTSLCERVANGEFAVVSTNFKQEGFLFKKINPNIILTGINFTFLNGNPAERVNTHRELPKLQKMLQRVADSLERVPETLRQISGRDMEPADWWKITQQKLRELDVLFYRTFAKDNSIPERTEGADVIQIPHPIPEIRLSRDEARAYIGKVIGTDLQEDNRIILLAGESSDGFFTKRLNDVAQFIADNPKVHALTPLKPNDHRLKDLVLPPNVHPIGFREDWMDIIAGADATFIRGSWGEILDAVASGTVPIITSPGTVPEQGDIGLIQFLTEVSGERAVNISLLVEELARKGVSNEILEGLLCDVADEASPDEVPQALRVALDPTSAQKIRAAFSEIQKDGIPWMVRLHEAILQHGKDRLIENRDRIEQIVWGDVSQLLMRDQIYPTL